MRFIPVFLLLAILYLSCGKDSFTTTPQLKYKSVNRTTIADNQVLVVKFRLTDKEGDFSPLLGMRRIVPGCPASEIYDSASFSIPDEFIKTKLTEGEVVISILKNKRGNNGCSGTGAGTTRPDTAVFAFWTRDRAGHTSDTARTEPIIVIN
ncbi:MAG TPA: hypothetical protein VFI06_14525 [Chitinophagaceae bacterium]|nr:hypothetical protein [Chitinophagaceae bacterium]